MLAGTSDWILSLDGWVALLIVFLGPALRGPPPSSASSSLEIAVILGGVLAFSGRVPLSP